MILTTRWTACYCSLFLCVMSAGCSNSKPDDSKSSGATQAELRAVASEAIMASAIDSKNEPALRQLEQNSGAAADAIKAIDIARAVAVNNLCNADTAAFKRSDALLEEGGKVQTRLDLTQGSMEATGNPLDIAIQGNGFFPVQIPAPMGSVGYTRAGNFFINGQGELILGLGDGYKLIPPIIVPTNATSVSIGTDGVVQYVKPDATVKSTAGQIKIATFPNPQGLTHIGGSLFADTNASGRATTAAPGIDAGGILLSGNLESSNVDIMHEAVRLRFLNEWQTRLIRAIGMRD